MIYALEELDVEGQNAAAICGDALKSAAKVSDPIVEPLEHRLRKKWNSKLRSEPFSQDTSASSHLN